MGSTAEESLDLLRVIQEAVTNALQHADARRIEVRVASADGPREALSVEILADGLGISTASPSGGCGIPNMKTRAAALGAELRIHSLARGTRVELSVPARNQIVTIPRLSAS